MEICCRNKRLYIAVIVFCRLLVVRKDGYVFIKLRIVHIPSEPAVFVRIKT